HFVCYYVPACQVHSIQDHILPDSSAGTERNFIRLGIDEPCEHRLDLEETLLPEIAAAFAGALVHELDIALQSAHGVDAERMLCRRVKVSLVGGSRKIGSQRREIRGGIDISSAQGLSRSAQTRSAAEKFSSIHVVSLA